MFPHLCGYVRLTSRPLGKKLHNILAWCHVILPCTAFLLVIAWILGAFAKRRSLYRRLPYTSSNILEMSFWLYRFRYLSLGASIVSNRAILTTVQKVKHRLSWSAHPQAFFPAGGLDYLIYEMHLSTSGCKRGHHIAGGFAIPNLHSECKTTSLRSTVAALLVICSSALAGRHVAHVGTCPVWRNDYFSSWLSTM